MFSLLVAPIDGNDPPTVLIHSPPRTGE